MTYTSTKRAALPACRVSITCRSECAKFCRCSAEKVRSPQPSGCASSSISRRIADRRGSICSLSSMSSDKPPSRLRIAITGRMHTPLQCVTRVRNVEFAREYAHEKPAPCSRRFRRARRRAVDARAVDLRADGGTNGRPREDAGGSALACGCGAKFLIFGTRRTSSASRLFNVRCSLSVAQNCHFALDQISRPLRAASAALKRADRMTTHGSNRAIHFPRVKILAPCAEPGFEPTRRPENRLPRRRRRRGVHSFHSSGRRGAIT